MAKYRLYYIKFEAIEMTMKSFGCDFRQALRERNTTSKSASEGGAQRNSPQRQRSAPDQTALGHVWTAPWQELSDVLQHWSGAVTCPAC